MSNRMSMTESRKTLPQTSSTRTVVSGNIRMVDGTEKKSKNSNFGQKIKSKLSNIGRLRFWLKWRNSKKIKSKEELNVFTMSDATSIISNITEEILNQVLLSESPTRAGKVDENRFQLQVPDNPLTKSCSLGFRESPSVSFSPDVEPSLPSTSSSSNPHLTTSEAIIEKIMSEASAVTVSSSNLSASEVSSDTLINGISGVNLENIMNDAIISQDPIELLLAINSQIESQTGRDHDTLSSPLYLMNESRTESYGGSSTSGNTSNATESESSSFSEPMETIESHMSEQDPNRQYYEVIRSIIRKQFESLDDDPPIY